MLPDLAGELFGRQYGVAANCQLQPLTAAERRRVLRHPDVERLTPRVLIHRIAPPVPERALLSAVFDGGRGAVLWGKSAVTFWGFGRFRSQPVHVGRPRTRLRGPRLGQMHLCSDLDLVDTTVHREIPVARPELAVLWLAGMWTHRFDPVIAADRTAMVLDQAWRQRLIDGEYLHELVERSGGRGRSGIVAMRQVLETRPPGYQPAGSRLEERFESVVPYVVRQHLDRQVTVDAEVTIRIVDYVHRRWPLIVEINGETWHSSLSDREADAARYRRLLELGYSVVVFWEYDVWHDPDVVRDTMLRLHLRPDPVPTLHRPTPAPWLF